ncbi:MAG: NADP-dependent malic enzyme, partial [Desulfosarcina sp.]|nr:NADP-dependent malic enzyme [Desulfobacterales bacterium]
MLYEKESIRYHSTPKPGKIEVVPLKPCLTQFDLSLAYTPGVAVPCKKIELNPELAFDYTSKGNLVGVITNGTAVLGLGDIGPLAGKPVMEGKAVLFKRFANIDVFDIEINSKDPDEFINTVKLLEPTFGGINLEDIKAPECFYIEEELKRQMSIPVFHDDQHGTAIISSAALLNASELTGRKITDLRVVINGAGASAIACAKMYNQIGVKKENITLIDTLGVIYTGRKAGMNPYKEQFAINTNNRTLEDAVKGTNVLLGLSAGGAFTPELLALMSEKPIIFALANPVPEIGYDEARAARPDAIVATGRSDYPNQVNNVLGFPFIFRGALDVRASTINEEMKIAAVWALAELAREDVSDSVIRAYGRKNFYFGPEYIIPTPLDSRVLLKVTPAVANAAIESGVARIRISSQEKYIQELDSTLGHEREIMRKIIIRDQYNPKRIVLPEGNHPIIIRAAHQMVNEGIAKPILLGDEDEIRNLAENLQIPLAGMEIVNFKKSKLLDKFSSMLFKMRARKGLSLSEARWQLRDPYVFGAMMEQHGMVDGQVHGINRTYFNSIVPVLQVIRRREGVSKISGMHLLFFKDRTLLFADTTVNIKTSAEDLAEIAILSAEMARFIDLEPHIAMISFSNFGNTRHPDSKKVEQAVKIVQQKKPDLIIDGEMQADTAISEDILKERFPFNCLKGTANTLIFPDLEYGNAAFKLLEQLGGAKVVGPLLMGLSKPFNVIQRNSNVDNVVNVAAITVV